MSKEIGRVLGTSDSRPLDFWVALAPDELVQLDDVVLVRRKLQNGQVVSIYGIVDELIARHEGARLESDVFLADQGVIPLNHALKAHVTATRVEPEIFVPPLPGDAVLLAAGIDRDQALFFDGMQKRLAIGLSRDQQVVYGNFEFLDGTRGAHVNISGISGVATKTSYATFLLYSVFHSDLLGSEGTNTHAIIFNVKGEDLLFLDQENNSLSSDSRSQYERLGLECSAFQSVGFWAPVQRDIQVMKPDTGTRVQGVTAYGWSVQEFCEERYLRFLFAETDDIHSQLGALIDRIEARLSYHDVSGLDTFDELKDEILANLEEWAGPAATGTRSAFQRRLEAAAYRVGHLIRGRRKAMKDHRIDWKQKQLTVVDIHNLHDRAKTFVVGVVLKRMFEEKERTGARKPLVFIVLDELNKYAPREGWSPIKDVLLDIAERGRSLGIILIGAQQTASEIERRVVANSAFRAVGRLDLAEAQRGEYGFLTTAGRARAGILKPGTLIVAQPEIPIPLLLQFPFPAWATRPSEVAGNDKENPFQGFD